ncbi:MAG: hypothetical protein PVJ57_14335 [Phycisphaerae bacterium]|jgi:hypothetical protein
MRHLRLILLCGLVLVTLGTLAGTLGYAWYLRSGAYRDYCATSLEEALGLPSEIGKAIPRSWTSREFEDVTVWLPGRRGKALSCERAVLRYTPRAKDPSAYEIDLMGGTSEISTQTWLREDYRLVVESGLRPGFDPDGPREVRFSDMDIRFARDQFAASLEAASGIVIFESAQHASATITCRAFNGHVAAQPALLHAQFSPRATGIRVDQLEFNVPTLPLSVLHLDGLAGVELSHGTFNGRLMYSEGDDGRRVSLSGMCCDVSLEECTTGLMPHPCRGTCPELELTELTLLNRRPERLRFRGVLNGVVLGDILAPWGLESIGGDLVLRVREADLSPNGIERLVASGECGGISLAALTQWFGNGRMSGSARLVIDDLTIEQNCLRSLNADLRIEDDDEAKWIEGRLVTEMVSRALKMDIPSWLPERIEYTDLGVRLDVRDEILHVFGTHGPGERTILTVRMFERDMPLITEPQREFDLSAWLEQMRVRAAEQLRQRIDELSTQPAPLLGP